jgi:chromosome segregation ATPase
MDTLQNQHNALQAELSASRDVLAAREREVEVLRMRCEEAEREVDLLREDLTQAKGRINTLLEMGGPAGFSTGSDEDSGDDRRRSAESTEEASMAFDKVSFAPRCRVDRQFSKELKQWERSRSPPQANGHVHAEDGRSQIPQLGAVMGQGIHQGAPLGHRRNSSDYSGDWVQ